MSTRMSRITFVLVIALVRPVAAEPLIVYVFAGVKSAAPASLFRIVEGKIENQQVLGNYVSYGLNNERLVTLSRPVGEIDGFQKPRIEVFNAKSGELITDRRISFKGWVRSPGFPVSEYIRLDSKGEYAFFQGGQKGSLNAPTPDWAVFAVHLSTMEINSYRVPEDAQVTKLGAMSSAFFNLPDGIVYVLEDGSLAKFSFDTRSFSTLPSPLNFLSDKSVKLLQYVSNLGVLCKDSEGKISLLADSDLKPSSQSREIVSTESVQRTVSLPEKNLLFYSCRSHDSRSDRNVDIVMLDTKTMQELWRKPFVSAGGKFRVSDDASRIVTWDDNARILRIYNRLEEKNEHEVTLPVSEMAGRYAAFDIVE